MKDFLCEIYTEELPAKIVNSSILQFKSNFETKLAASRLTYSEIKAFSTPKRLVVFINNLSDKEKDIEIEVKGPSEKISIDGSGNKLAPYFKFIESNNFEEKDVFIKEVKKNRYFFGKKLSKGRNANDLMKEITLTVLREMHFQKSMRWNESDVSFVRPIRNILLLLGEEIIDFNYAGLKSNNYTYGLYCDTPTRIEIKNINDYFLKLKENYVIVSYDDRKKIVEERSSVLASKAGGMPIYTEEFFEEVVNMNEYPTPFICSIQLCDLKTPDCIVASVIKDHLKSFPLMGIQSRKLIPFFIAVRNGTSDFIDTVREGYERVAKARILDGNFFFDEDRKITFQSYIEKLAEIVFLGKMGSMKDKTERLVKLVVFLTSELKLGDDETADLKRASYLAKGDLVTNVVREFPELQGTMGGIYSELSGENANVSIAISEQYLPRFTGDKLPESILGKYLSLIDRIDTLVASFISGIEYSSSKDPFGLRRLGSGIAHIAFEILLDKLPLEELTVFSIETFNGKAFDKKSKKSEILNFLRDRAVSVMKEHGIRYDVANAIATLHIDLMPTYLNRALILMRHLNDEKLATISTTYKRIRNILDKANLKEFHIEEKLLFEKTEEELYKLILESRKTMDELLLSKDYGASLSLLYILESSVGKFFDNVLVMDENENIRRNRLALLNNLKILFESFADFSYLTFDNKIN
jgi:glycyl-tRNA synthetase beta chain